ncbi:MAG: thiol protease/hemagglutinin PrtT [Muribaculaceae bacterium]
MKKTIALIFSLLICMPFMARQITEAEAIQKAKNFTYENNTTKQTQNLSKINKNLKLSYSCKNNDESLFYVFNRGENQGFVIISGDDRANEILGYSDSGSFDYEKIPVNMKAWLEEYAKEIKTLIENPQTTTTVAPVFNQKNYAPSVAPLLDKTAWGQSEPYNNLCPIMPSEDSHSVTGCVATAMAQVMYYNRWPINGTGEHSYTYNGKNISANFNTTYDWANMTPTYDSSSSQASNDAVAKLMYHCGVAVEMQYSNLVSNAYIIPVAFALNQYFGYDKGVRVLSRNYYGIAEWIDMIKNELNSQRAILYAGQAIDGGHAFVFDGYDKNNFFHVNWGWDGMENGYFQVTALNPSSQGTGGYAGGYNSSQEMIIGIQKETGKTTKVPEIVYSRIFPDKEEYSRNEPLTITGVSISNYGWYDFDGTIALGLYQNSNLVKVLSEKPLIIESGTDSGNSIFSGIIPSNIINGDYEIKLICKEKQSNDWRIAMSDINNIRYIKLSITADKLTLSPPENSQRSLSVSNLIIPQKIYSNRVATISCDISNSGAEYYGAVKIKISTAKEFAMGPDYTINLQMGESISVVFNDAFNIPAGKYKLEIVDLNESITANPIDITILPEPADAILTLTETPSFPDKNNVPKDDIQITAKIKNTGGYFYQPITAGIFNENSDDRPLTSFSSPKVEIDNNATTEVTFHGKTDLANGKYLLRIYHRLNGVMTPLAPDNLNQVVFTLGNPSGVNDVTVESTKIYPNPATNNVTITSDKGITEIRIYDMAGALKLSKDITQQDSGKIDVDISTLAKGYYLVQIVGANSMEVKPLIKKE